MKLKLISKESLTTDVLKLIWEKPTGFTYLPGQFIKLTLPSNNEKIKRSYSLTSHPTENFLENVIKLAPNGKASEIFAILNVGDEVEALGPYGKFILAPVTRPLVFVATGTGISPEISMLKATIKFHPVAQSIYLFFGLKNKAGRYFHDELRELKNLKNNFTYYYCLSDETEAGENILCKRTTNAIAEMFPNLPEADWYLCGIPQSIMDCEKLLTDKGVPSSQIHFEHFTPAHK